MKAKFIIKFIKAGTDGNGLKVDQSCRSHADTSGTGSQCGCDSGWKAGGVSATQGAGHPSVGRKHLE